MTNNNQQPKLATLDDVLTVLQKNQETLDQILVWMKISGIEKLKKVLETTLDSPQKRLVYQLSDGRPGKEIVESSKVSAGAVSGYWKTWKNLGLMKTQKVMGGERSIRVFDLEDFGIDVSKTVAKQQQLPEQLAVAVQNQMEVKEQ